MAVGAGTVGDDADAVVEAEAGAGAAAVVATAGTSRGGGGGNGADNPGTTASPATTKGSGLQNLLMPSPVAAVEDTDCVENAIVVAEE